MAALLTIFRWILLAIIGVPLLLTGLVIGILSSRRANRIAIFFDWLVLQVFGIELIVIDENQGDYADFGHLFVMLNQTSFIDLFAGGVSLPTYVKNVVNIEYALFFPMVGWYSFAQRDIVLIRQWPKQAKNALARAVSMLASQANFWISIEGKMTKDGSLSPYKKGPAIMAINAQADVVPMSFRGGRDILPRGQWIPKPGKLEVHFHKKISTKNMTLEQRDELTQRLRSIAEDALF